MNLLRRTSLGLFAVLVLPSVVGTACRSADNHAPGPDASQAVVNPLTPPEQDAVHEILIIEDHRLLGNTKLAGYLGSNDPIIVAAAATAVGRIGDPSLEPQVVDLLSAANAQVRLAATLAIELIGGSTVEAPLLSTLAGEHDPNVRVGIFDALGHVGSVASLPALGTAITGNDPSDQGAAAEALGRLVASGVAAPTDAGVLSALVSLAQNPSDSVAAPAAFALVSIGSGASSLEAQIATASQNAPSDDARASLADTLGKIATPTALDAIANIAENDYVDRVRAEAAADLGSTGATSDALTALSYALYDYSDAVVIAAAGATASLGSAASSLGSQLAADYDGGSVAVQTAVIVALATTDPTDAFPRAEAALSSNAALPLRIASVDALYYIGTPAALTTLTGLIVSTNHSLAIEAMGDLSNLSAANVTAAMKSNAAAALAASTSFEVASGVSWLAGSFGWTDFAPTLAADYANQGGDPNIDGRINILWALGQIGSSAQLPVVQQGLKDDQRQVALQAAASYQALTGMNVSSQVPLQSIVSPTIITPSAFAVQAAVNSRVVMQTARGNLVIQMLSSAPLSAVNFTNLVNSGFYNGLDFHRVIPNFIAQGGDPLGDGYGATTFVRDEFSQVPHLQGAVGLATLGKDTGSCQFFFDLSWNESLDGNYTLFGTVDTDLSTIDALEEGDKIESAYVVP
jgi:cyclophilin family peptidyl-prolyl cis-trans isomerase/HEAT repeat protein